MSCLELDVSAKRGDDHRTAVAVVTRIDDVLHTGRQVNTAPSVDGVVGLKDVFAAVIQLAVAEQESQTARREIVLVIFLDAVGHERDAGTILLAMPPSAVGSHALREGLVHLRVGEGLGLAVVPSEAAEGGEIVRETLLQVDAEAVFARDVLGMGGDVGSAVLRSGLDDLIAVDAHVGVVGVGQQADHASFFRDHAVT